MSDTPKRYLQWCLQTHGHVMAENDTGNWVQYVEYERLTQELAQAKEQLAARLRVFRASYYWHGSYGAYEEKEYIVIANTKEEALGIVLEAEAKTNAKNWEVTEIDIDEAGTIHINERGS